MPNEIAIRPSYWASVSGGKDSFYMLNLILHNLDRYPLDGVVHFELEIDYPFIRDVIDYMESECKRFGIRFVRIKPSKTWDDLYHQKSEKTGNIWGFPTRKARWCNSQYKLDAERQLREWMLSLGFYTVQYIGYCADEEKRCGCMYCPMANFISFAYLLKYYPDNFNFMIGRMRETEKIREAELGRPFSITSSNPKYNADYLENIIKTKWLKKLNEMEKAPLYTINI